MRTRLRARRTRWYALFALAVLPGCEQPLPAYGEASSIIAVMAPATWADVRDVIRQALEPTIATVRDERTFTVTYQDPSLPAWRDLRRLRQILLVGSGEEPWMRPALEVLRREVTGPGIYHAYDVWARGQQVTVILADPGHEYEAVQAHIPDIHRSLDEQFRQQAVHRMLLTGPDTPLADSLMNTAGFRLLVPNVYEWKHTDSVYVFRNDNPDPSELIRQVTITWRSPVPEKTPDVEDLLAWRAELTASYREPQEVDLRLMSAEPGQWQGREGYQVQALWVNPPTRPWPAAGPFITRTVRCAGQGRQYLLDAWLYAPGKQKYEYMIQLETILDSFRCGAARDAVPRAAP